MSKYIYIIINTIDLDKVDFNEVLTTSKYTVRKNVNGSLGVLKFEGIEPDSLLSIEKIEVNNRKYFNHSMILEVLDSSDWKIENNLI